MIECPNCNKLMWHQIDDDGVDEWYCHTCGETFIGSGDWPMPEERDDFRPVPDGWEWYFSDEFEAPEPAEFVRTPATPRQRIQAAVQSVCEAASRIRVLLGGKEELPF